MDLLLILTYTAICVAIFKLFRIPLNKWTVPTAVLGGIVLIGALIFLMNYNHPYSEVSRSFRQHPDRARRERPGDRGAGAGNRILEKGDVLFRIDPTPFENRVKSLKAQLVSAKADQFRASELARRNVGNLRDVDTTRARMDDLQGQLNIAQFELDNTTVRAPGKGYVTQVSLRPGIYAVKMPLRPAMVFVPLEDHSYVAWMRQNSQLRLTPGDEAEIAFDGIPGEVFAARVKMVMPVIAEGQVQPGNLIGFTGSPRRAACRWCWR